MKQKVGKDMAILSVTVVNDNNSGLVYEKHETYAVPCLIEMDLQKFVSFLWRGLLYWSWVLGLGSWFMDPKLDNRGTL